jgi:CRISPR system Cascade subunit CasA
MAQYNALTEPWIPVRMLTGEEKEVGILELLENAHRMEAITDASPLMEYGIYRLMTVFLMDALRPERQQDIQDLLDAGVFNMESISDYVQKCEKDGPCFDMFDEKRPFLQSPYDEMWDKSEKPASVMLHELPGGNNPLHFAHVLENAHVICPAVCLKAICAVNVFCTAGLQGPSSINGRPPLYILVKGDNLFEGLILNIIPSRRSNLPYQTPPPVWRGDTRVEPGAKLAETSLLEGMTLLARRMTLIADEEGGTCSQTGRQCQVVVRKMFFQKGLDYIGYEAWRDPHVIYMINEKGRMSLKPQLGKQSWRNIGSMFECGDQKAGAEVIHQYREFFEYTNEVIPYVTFGLVTTQAQYESWLRDEASMDMRIASSSERIEYVRLCIERAELAANALKRQLRIIFESFGGAIIEESVGMFFMECREQFFTSLCPKLAEADIYQPGIAIGIVQHWNNILRAQVFKAFNECADRLGMSGRYLLKQADAQIGLAKQLKKILKGGDKE